ncbi:hybrid PKS-NRPS PsoA [Hypoxylon argillaceum]|nr:hybrid PKS-NRPS PsoA [Hypoxylon argillaceum]
MLSPSGRCRMWDSSADGYGRGEGFASIVVKTLSEAISNRDHIECIIRETGVGQDGRTPGLTMPSSTSQASLIQSTYRRCGLDPRKKEDRCQYFEAHGTGTQAGDPKEAEAIYNAFFSTSTPETSSTSSNDTLHVGSVKTVIGHTEGTAGLAGLLKALLAVKHGVIPPNLLFDTLNPAIAPFAQRLHIPTALLPWPKTPPSIPKRASVNSFGFGGTNAHVIIESWEDVASTIGFSLRRELEAPGSPEPPYGPFTLSASSASALKGMVASLSYTLKSDRNTNLSDLAWTLQSRRSEFPYKAAVSAEDKEQLIDELSSLLAPPINISSSPLEHNIVHTSKTRPARILGVFTGQGAQWASMGTGLYAYSACFRDSIARLEKSLANAPDPPSWSLSEALVALSPESASRLHTAEFAQPLTTALQIALTDLLRASGVIFNVVVGHSSGEIAAAYAAGFLSASDAILIAYYRGFHSRSSNRLHGKMMAVGMNIDEAQKFCGRPEFSCKLRVAASNSRSSSTISGDADAIEKADAILREEGKFSRILKVDRAYHSHHMNACAADYVESLRRCAIRPLDRGGCNGTSWYSSVLGADRSTTMDADALKGEYWAQNMVKPVLFLQAMTRAVEDEYCTDLVLEVGPHPALKVPATETLKSSTGKDIPYNGVLEREKNDFIAFSTALGSVWKSLYPSGSVPDFEGFRIACQGESAPKPQVHKGLPPYSWDHNTPMLKESKISRDFRTRDRPLHPLLGRETSHGGQQEMRWRNVLKLTEMEWLRGHQFQNQVIFPAAGYVSMAIDANLRLVEDKSIELIELYNLDINRAIIFEDESSEIAVNFVIRVTGRSPNCIATEFHCYNTKVDASSRDSEHVCFTGQASILLGNPDHEVLPCRVRPVLPLTSVSTSRFYRSMSKVGLDYSGDFLVDSIQRRMNYSTVRLKKASRDASIHTDPASLDAAFHSIFAAFSYPGDGRMWAPYLPTRIQRVRVSMARCREQGYHDQPDLVADCHLREASAREICGDVEISCSDDNHTEIQVEGIVCASFTEPSSEDDRKLFARTIWRQDVTSGIEPQSEGISHAEDEDLSDICERTAYFYLRQLVQHVPREKIPSLEPNSRWLMEWVLDYLTQKADAKHHLSSECPWETDTHDTIMRWKRENPSRADLQLLHKLGEALPLAVRNGSPPQHILNEGSLLNEVYTKVLGIDRANARLGAFVGQLAHRYPRMKILDVGAGVGGTTAHVLEQVESALDSYTFTETTSASLKSAQKASPKFEGKMRYRVLDIERGPAEQGFEESSFDLVIVSNILRETKCLPMAMQNCRKLLRPGGYLCVLHNNNETFGTPALFSVLIEWWLGRTGSSIHQPTLTESDWDSLFKENGFSGVDTSCSVTGEEAGQVFSVMATQALDHRIQVLRNLLAMAANDIAKLKHVIIIGGRMPPVQKLVHGITQLLHRFSIQVDIYEELNDLQVPQLGADSAAICLADLEEPIFKKMDQTKLHALQALLEHSRYVVWGTIGCRGDSPYANMAVGMGRSLMLESSHLHLQYIDFKSIQDSCEDPAIFTNALLRMVYLDSTDCDDLLWSAEEELAVEDGKLYIPRVLPDVARNNRLNSTRRAIYRSVCPISVPVEVSIQAGKWLLQEVVRHEPLGQLSQFPSSEFVEVVVEASSLFPIEFEETGPVYLCIGTVFGTRRRVLCVSSTNSSLARVIERTILDWKVKKCNDKQSLAFLLTVLASESLIMSTKGTVWVHDADEIFAAVLSRTAARKGTALLLTTSSYSPSNRHMKLIHPRATLRALGHIIPYDTRRLINMSSRDLTSWELFLESRERKVQTGQLGSRNGRDQLSNNKFAVFSPLTKLDTLGQILDSSDWDDLQGQVPVQEVKLQDLGQGLEQQGPFSIIDWSNIDSVSVPLNPIHVEGLFSDQKTYFLVGLAGEVGLSLCGWMIENGARYFAIMSRSPKTDRATLDYLQSKGACIKTYGLDIASEEGLRSVHRDIVATMPPIGGVANGAMVLRDKPFPTMTMEDFEDVLRPKVKGTQNLDELFYSIDLEFFILFSSVACIIGNPYQANYAAANMFMKTLANQRRQRGLAASVMDMSVISGIGYVANSGEWLDSHLRNRMDLMPVSETDFHTIFSEAVVSGRPDSELGHDMIIGLGSNPKAPWRRLSRFSHYVSLAKADVQDDLQNGSPSSLRGQVAEARDVQQAVTQIKNAVSQKMSHMLRMPAENIAQDVPLVSLGIDSLTAVEIRSWFLKELSVDMPVLSILNGSSITNLCQGALAKLSNSLRDASKKTPKPVIPSPEKLVPYFEHEITLATAPSASPLELPITSNGVPPGTQSIVTKSAPKVNVNGPKGPLSLETGYSRKAKMAESQARIYFLHNYLEDKSTFTVAYVGKYHGQIDGLRLEGALKEVGLKHESLRTSYFVEEASSQPVQAVNRMPNIQLVHEYVTNEAYAEHSINKLRKFVFDIEHGLLMKVFLLTQGPSLHHVVVLHHHIALDGASWPTFLQDLSDAYAGRSLEHECQQAIDMSLKQAMFLQTACLQKGLAFWSELYRGSNFEPIPLFPFAKRKSRQAVDAYNTATVTTHLDTDLTDRVKRAALELQITPFHFYLSALGTFLSRCLSINDLAIGIMDANRIDTDDEHIVGCFLNMLPLRLRFGPDETFARVAHQSRDVAFAALSNRLPFDVLLDNLKGARYGDHHPMFQVALNYRAGFQTQTSIGDGTMEWTGGILPRNPYDLTVDITEFPESTVLCFSTQSYLYGRTDTQRMLSWFTRALEGFALESSTKVHDCPISNKEDIEHVTKLGLGEFLDVTWSGTVIDRIDQMASEHADTVALKNGNGHTLTYAEMVARSRQIASGLLATSAITAGSRVATLLQPTPDAICCILGVMRTGSVWVPLDLRNPEGRLATIISEAQPTALVYHESTQELAHQLLIDDTFQLINLNKLSSPIQVQSGENASQLDQPAVVLYTSGSTGIPKGALLSHASITNQVFVNSKVFGVGQEVVLQQSSFGFDLVLEQTFHALCNGGTLIVASHEDRGEPTRLAQLILMEGVTYTHFVPSEYLSLIHYGFRYLQKCDRWRFAFAGGEKIQPQLRMAFQRLGLSSLQLINVYGPVETTVSCARGIVPYSTEEDIEAQSDRLLPLPNYSVSVVDEQMRPVPIGFPGEVLISGVGVGLGYLNRPEETLNKFYGTRGCSYQPKQGEPLTRHYRTRDKGRILEDGSLDILGRLDGDGQVKIRGIRIELDEIANVIIKAAKGLLTNAAVSYRPASDTLVAFASLDSSFDGDRVEAMKQINATLPLPVYMCPVAIIPVDKIPVNVHGKKDRAAIDKMPIPDMDDSESPALTQAELLMREAWKEVIGHRRTQWANIGPDSEFFHAGGNSLLLIKLRRVLSGRFGATLTLPQLFQFSTLRSMTRLIEAKSIETGASLPDWSEEISALVDGYRQSCNNAVPSPSVADSSARVVLLTGATGFLGAKILQHLVGNETVCEVHCVAIRPDDCGNPRHVSVKSDKIIEYAGDLRDATLGLSAIQLESLAQKVDVIIHNGADVSFMKTYQSLRSANVVSTAKLCEIALSRHIPLHFVSTAGVARFPPAAVAKQGGYAGLPEMSVSAYPPPPDTADGYETSKWASECLLERVCQDYGVPVWIHRPSSILGDGAPELDIMAAVLRYSKALRAVPELEGVVAEGSAFDFVGVEDVSKAVVETAITSSKNRGGQGTKTPGVQYVHHCSSSKVAFGELQQCMEEKGGEKFEKIAFGDWLDRALGQGMNPLVHGFLNRGLVEGKKITIPVIVNGPPNQLGSGA